MRICHKCNTQVDGTGKICRSCGGILEEVIAGEPAPEGPAQVGDEQMPSSPPSSVVEEADPAAEAPDLTARTLGAAEVSGGSAWRCQNCSEVVPGNFDSCWKCLTTRTGELSPEADQLLSEVREYSDLDDSESETELLEVPNREATAQAECPRCGSTKLIHDVTTADQGQGSDGKLNAVVFGNPQALFFKNRLFGEIRADICGSCGHIEFRVANASELYNHYQDAQGAGTPFQSPSRYQHLPV